MTAMQKAFENAGLHPRDAEMNLAIAKYVNSGGTLNGIRALVDAAEKMPGMDQSRRVSNDQPVIVQTRQPVEDGGANEILPQGHQSAASPSSSNRGGRDLYSGVRKNQTPHVPFVREPSEAQRKASAEMRKLVNIGVLQTHKIDGRSVGKFTVGEAIRYGKEKTKDGYVLTMASRVVRNAPHHALLEETVKQEEMQLIIKDSAEFANDM